MNDLTPLAQAHCVARRGSEHRLCEARVRELLPEVPFSHFPKPGGERLVTSLQARCRSRSGRGGVRGEQDEGEKWPQLHRLGELKRRTRPLPARMLGESNRENRRKIPNLRKSSILKSPPASLSRRR